MTESDQYYARQTEPVRGCLIALRDLILDQENNIASAWKYRMPFFCFHGRMFCYLWTNKQTGQPYIGFVEGKRLHHPDLIQDKRARMKILNIDASGDIPVRKIRMILRDALDVYRSGAVKISMEQQERKR